MIDPALAVQLFNLCHCLVLKLLLTDCVERNEKSGYVNTVKLHNQVYKFPRNFNVKCQRTTKYSTVAENNCFISSQNFSVFSSCLINKHLLSTCGLFSFSSLLCFLREGNPQYFLFGISFLLPFLCPFSFFGVSVKTYSLHTEFWWRNLL
jgi:hypothetical protein